MQRDPSERPDINEVHSSINDIYAVYINDLSFPAFKEEHTLGHGRFGIVHLYTNGNEKIALKKKTDPGWISDCHFENEISVFKRLGEAHPNIVTYFSHEQIPLQKSLCIYMEACKCNLEQYVRNTGFLMKQIVDVISQVSTVIRIMCATFVTCCFK